MRLATSRTPEVSVVVAFTADAARARRCLEHLGTALDGGRLAYEVVCVDNGARPDVGAVLRDEVDGHRLLHSAVDLGIPFAWREAIGAARAERLLLVIHEDTELQPETLPELLAVLDAQPGTGAVAARIHTPEGRLQSAGRMVFADGRDAPVVDEALVAAGEPYAVDRPSSATVLLDRGAYDACGGVDTAFFPAVCVDADLGMALWAAGARVLCAPRARSVHASGAMIQADGGPTRSALFSHFLQQRAYARMADKWRDELAGRVPHEAGIGAALEVAAARPAPGWPTVPRSGHPLRDAEVAEIDPSLQATAAALREALHEEFVGWLVEREGVLGDEIAWRDRRIAELEGLLVGANEHLDEVTVRLAEMGERALRAEADRGH